MGGGGVVRISSDGGDQRIFWGLEFTIPGFFWVGKFGKYVFVWLCVCLCQVGGSLDFK